jgi:sugar phosphate isomerase/epimerase
MNDSVFNPMKIAVLYYFGDLGYWKLPDVAADALAAGFDGIALGKLAGLTNVVASDLIPSDVDAAFREMGVAAPISKDAARLSLAAESVRRALVGEANVFDEATHIRIHLCELNEPPPELHRIVDLARQSRSAPRATWETLERELRSAMYQFLQTQTLGIDATR